jgi:hypothetical protein
LSNDLFVVIVENPDRIQLSPWVDTILTRHW